MRINLSTTLIVLGVLLIVGVLGSWLLSTAPSNRPQSGIRTDVQYTSDYKTSEHSPDTGPLLPQVVTTATKLGQGRKAVSGLPRVEAFERPSVRTSDAGSALVIPGSTLPGSHWMTSVTPLPPLTSGNKPRIKYDIYSWSLGTLRATTSAWIDLSEPDAEAAVPTKLLEHANSLSSSARLMLVLPPNSATDSPATARLNPFDAYIVVADVLVPAL